MALHVHFKDGKFRIYDTISEQFITDWVDPPGIESMFVEGAEYRARELAKQRMAEAMKYGCDAAPWVRCKKEEL